MQKSKREITKEFGDFQTPPVAAAQVCELLARRSVEVASILEPTCGKGNFLLAAVAQFPMAQCAVGFEINPAYVAEARQRAQENHNGAHIEIVEGNFFEQDWSRILAELPQPILIVGNPPWVTNAELGTLNSDNLPAKRNFKTLSGLEAKTGKSNFDISEWMLIQLLEAARHSTATLAMLCKTGVARKVLIHAWRAGLPIAGAQIHTIDAKAMFNAAVDSCLLMCKIGPEQAQPLCRVYDGLALNTCRATWGCANGQIIADMVRYERWRHLEGNGPYQWRSGVKHDCAQVMELTATGDGYVNKAGHYHELERDYLYPMLKSSEVAASAAPRPSRWMLVPQRAIGDDTRAISVVAPQTWNYLNHYGALLDQRKSTIYKRQPRFAIFGVGKYSFAPWKVAISGLYKKLHFAVVAPFADKPVVLDDTCYFIPCQNAFEAHTLANLLNSDTAKDFLNTFIFWDAKRPITVDILQRLDLLALAQEVHGENTLAQNLCETIAAPSQQLVLF